MIRSADFSENRPSVVDAMQACEKNSSAKDDSAHNMRLLPEGYKPGENDVLCGRGRKCFNHAGNVKFRAIVQSFLPQYSKAVAKLEKSYILSDVVDQVRKNSGEGGFIKKDPDTGRWYEVGDFLAREKTSQAFRDVLHDKYKSSNTAKKKRRQEEQAEKILVRAHSNRSLGGNSLDTSSVHSVGSSTTGDYMLSDTKLMRRERLERSNSILNLGDPEDGGAHDDLLGGLDQDIASYGRSRNVSRQRSLRAVLDCDSNRRAVLTRSDDDPPSLYNRSSCPNLFSAPVQPQRSSNTGTPTQQHQQQPLQQHRSHHSSSGRHRAVNNNGSVPPISHIEIFPEDSFQAQSNNIMLPDTLESSAPFHDFDPLDPGDGSVASNSSSTAGVPSSTGSQSNWFHHSQPNLFGDIPPINPQGGQRRGFARQPPNRKLRRPMRHNSAGPTGGGGTALLGVQLQIDNLGLNDSNHGQSSYDTSGGGGHSQRNVRRMNTEGNRIRMNGGDFGGDDDDDHDDTDRHYLPHGLHYQQQHPQQQMLGMNQSLRKTQTHPGEVMDSQGVAGNNGILNMNNINNHNGGMSMNNRNGGISMNNRNGGMNMNNHNGGMNMNNHNGGMNMNNHNGGMNMNNHNGGMNMNNHNGGMNMNNHNGGINMNNHNGGMNMNNHNGAINMNTRNGGINMNSHNGVMNVIDHNHNNNNNNNNPTHLGDDDCDGNLLARLQSLDDASFGMDVIDENPFEPVPLGDA